MSKKEKSVSGVALPPGSFELQKLDKELSKAASIDDADEQRDAVSSAIEKQNNGEKREIEQGARPDQKRTTVKREDLGVEEEVLVHDAKSDAAEASAEEAEEEAEKLAAQQEKRAEAMTSAPKA